MKKITLLFLLLTTSLSYSQIVLTEDFESGLTVPAGWSVEDLTAPPSGEVWTIVTGGAAGGFTSPNTLVYDSGGDGNYATFNSDGYGDNGTAEESTLTSPVFDCSSLTSVTLSFVTVYNGNFGGLGVIEVYNGTSWVNIQTYATEVGGTPNTTVTGIQTFDVPELVGVSNAQIRFRWTGNWSISWSIDNISVFQCTIASPDAVSAITPANGANGVDINYGTPRNLGPFEWDPAATGDPADSYNISLGTNGAGDNIGVIEGFDIGNSIDFNWQPNTTYFWFIEAVNCAGSTASPVFSFTTAACTDTTVPDAVTSPGPEDGATDVTINADDNSLAFSWTAGDLGDSFTLNFGTTDPPTQSFSNFENGGLITGLEENTTYFWSVNADNCFGTTPGPVWSFTTGVALSIDENQFNVFSAYPNPTQNFITIKASQDIDNITIFNLLGQNVASFKNSDITENSVDLSRLSNGMYLVKISSGNQTETIRITKE